MADPQEQVLVASMHDVRQLATILRGVNIYGKATLSIAEAGLNVTVEEARTLVAVAYIPFGIFDEYKYVPESDDLPASQESDPPCTMIDIPLDTLLECLNIFGTAISSSSSTPFDKRKKKKWRQASDDENEAVGKSRGGRGVPKGNATIDQYFSTSGQRRTVMRMSYTGAGHPLKLLLAEDAAGPTTTCEIQTMACESVVDLPFDASRNDTYNSPGTPASVELMDKVDTLLHKSSWLRDALSELDPSCEKVTFIGTPISDPDPDDSEDGRRRTARPTLRLSAEGTFGSTQMDYPNDREVLETFECAVPVKFTYHVTHIKSALRALQSSSKTSLRIDDEGLLSLQFMMAKSVFLEFRCLSFEDDV